MVFNRFQWLNMLITADVLWLDRMIGNIRKDSICVTGWWKSSNWIMTLWQTKLAMRNPPFLSIDSPRKMHFVISCQVRDSQSAWPAHCSCRMRCLSARAQGCDLALLVHQRPPWCNWEISVDAGGWQLGRSSPARVGNEISIVSTTGWLISSHSFFDFCCVTLGYSIDDYHKSPLKP